VHRGDEALALVHRLLRLDASGADHLAEALVLALDHPRESLGDSLGATTIARCAKLSMTSGCVTASRLPRAISRRWGWRSAGATSPIQVAKRVVRESASAAVGTLAGCEALLAGDGERFQAARLDLRQRRLRQVEHHLDASAHQVPQRLRGALYGTCVSLVPVTDWNTSPAR